MPCFRFHYVSANSISHISCSFIFQWNPWRATRKHDTTWRIACQLHCLIISKLLTVVYIFIIVHVPNLPTGDNLFVSENAPFRSLCWARIGSIRLWIAMFKYHEVVSGRQFGPQLPSFFEVNSVTVALPLSKTRRELIFGQVASVLLGKQWPVAAAKPWGGET